MGREGRPLTLQNVQILRRFAGALFAVLMAVAALVGSSGVANADPEDSAPPIIEDLIVIIPGLTQDYRASDTPNNFGTPRDWTGSGMFCQNRIARCQKMGF
jgi:hypothetical protein